MPDHCPKCGAEIFDNTIDCECGFRVREYRLQEQNEMMTGAIEGWRRVNEADRARVRELESWILEYEWEDRWEPTRDCVPCCPECSSFQGEAHKTACKLGAACDRIRKERENEHASNDQVHG